MTTFQYIVADPDTHNELTHSVSQTYTLLGPAAQVHAIPIPNQSNQRRQQTTSQSEAE